jgi:guanylate cyclase
MTTSGFRALSEGFLDLGASPSDTPQEKAYKATHVLMSSVTAAMGTAWSVMYWVLGVPLAAAIPSTYAVLTAVGLMVISRTKRIARFRAIQMTMWLTLPFFLQWSLGGFANGSAVGVWAVGAPLLASLIGAVRWPWFIGFVGLSVISGLLDSTLAASPPPIPQGLVTGMFVLNFFGVAYVTYLSLGYFVRERERTHAALEREQEKSEGLLLNILPSEVATRLKAGEEIIADRVEGVTILFADLVGSTELSERLTANQLVKVLNDIFTPFDDLADRFGLEKIKTLGDAYMVVGGLPLARADHVEAIADMALAMREELVSHAVPGFGRLRMRYGIHTGPVVAGVIGKRKFSYDLWGDTVNTAARMESHGIPDAIQVTEDVYETLRDRYSFTPRGPVQIRGKGEMSTYLLEARIAKAVSSSLHS